MNDKELADRLPPSYDPHSFVPGFNVRFIELENACAFLVGQGWAGLLSFDEAVMAAHRQTKRCDFDCDACDADHPLDAYAYDGCDCSHCVALRSRAAALSPERA